MSKAGKPWAVFGCSPEESKSPTVAKKGSVSSSAWTRVHVLLSQRLSPTVAHTLCLFVPELALHPWPPGCSPCSAVLQQKFLLTACPGFWLCLSARAADPTAEEDSGSCEQPQICLNLHNSVQLVFASLVNFECSGLGIVPVGWDLWGDGGGR